MALRPFLGRVGPTSRRLLLQGEGFEIQAKTDLLLRTGVQFSSVQLLSRVRFFATP